MASNIGCTFARLFSTISMSIPDVEPEMAMGMIMPRCSPGFFPGMKPFTNGGPLGNGQPIRDRSRYMTAIEEIKWQTVLLLMDYLQGANGTDQKLALYVSVRVIKFLPDRQDLCINEWKKDGLRKVYPYHPNAKDNSDLPGPPLVIKGRGVTTQTRCSRSWVCTHGPIRLAAHGWWQSSSEWRCITPWFSAPKV